MKLKDAHTHELWSIGKRGLATLIAVLLFWGTTAPTIFHEHDIYTLSRYSGISATCVLIGCFYSSYRNLLTPYLSKKERQMGFVIFWFSGSLFFDLVWQVPYWTVPMISEAPKTMDGLYWKICWWSYTLHDTWYDSLTREVIVFEIWWLLGNIFGAVGLYKFYNAGSGGEYRHKQQTYNETLLLFTLCGALQCYNATVYLFMSYFVHNFANIPNHILSQAIFWGLNGFWCFASAVAATFSYRLLLDNYLLLADLRRSQST
jgi:hypothetical protein